MKIQFAILALISLAGSAALAGDHPPGHGGRPLYVTRFPVSMNCAGFPECEAAVGSTSGNANYVMALQEGTCGNHDGPPNAIAVGTFTCTDSSCTVNQAGNRWIRSPDGGPYQPRRRSYAVETFIAFNGEIEPGPGMISDLVCCFNYEGNPINETITGLIPAGPMPGSNLPPSEGCVVNNN